MPDAPARPLTICHVDAERGFSGGEVQVFLLMHGLRERGHRSILVAPPGSRSAERAAREGFEVRAVAMRSDLDLPAVLEAAAVFRALAPDLVHLHTSRAAWLGGLAAWLGGLAARPGGLAARRARIPAIVTRRMDRAVSRGWRTRLVYGRLTRATAAISASVARSLEAGGVDPARIVVIPSSIDAGLLVPARTRAEVRAELEAGAEEPVILTLGALVRRKGLDVLFAALAELAARGVTPRAWIVGDGEARGELEALARARGLARVRFLGARADVADLLGAADVFAMPSRREGLGVAALEALAAGCPVVASRVGGLAEVVEDGASGLLVPPEDPPALARALERLLADLDLRERCARQGRARVAERHGAAGMVARYEALYRRVLAAAPLRAHPPR